MLFKKLNNGIENVINDIRRCRFKEAIKERIIRDVILKPTNDSEFRISSKYIDKLRSMFNIFKML